MGAPYFQIRDELKQKGVKVFSSNYALYSDFSQRVINSLSEFVDRDDDLEVYSIDEAFLHLAPLANLHDPVAYCHTIRTTVEQWTGIPVSIGIAPTKTLAKIANVIAKKYKGYGGIFHLDTSGRHVKVLESTPVGEVWGIGRSLSKKLNDYGVFTALQLRDCNDTWIRKIGGVLLLRTVHELRGKSCFFSDAVPDTKKGIASTRSFGKAVTTIVDLQEAVSTYVSRAAVKLRRQESVAGALHVFIRTSYYGGDSMYHNSAWHELPVHTDSTPELIHHAMKMLGSMYREGLSYKKAGVMLSNIIPRDTVQLTIFDTIDRTQHSRAMQVMDRINLNYGNDIVRFAISGKDRPWIMRSDLCSKQYTTRWKDLLEVNLG
jgi:DNA polymerase V